MKCVYCAVRTGSLHKEVYASSFKGWRRRRAMQSDWWPDCEQAENRGSCQNIKFTDSKPT